MSKLLRGKMFGATLTATRGAAKVTENTEQRAARSRQRGTIFNVFSFFSRSEEGGGI
jgi:hypothetical protein